MDQVELKRRTKQLAIRVIRLARTMRQSEEQRVIARQIIRSACSVGANYRAACRARTKAEFAAKIGIVEEEADETCFWIELIVEAQIKPAGAVTDLLNEANEITAIMAAAHKTTRLNNA